MRITQGNVSRLAIAGFAVAVAALILASSITARSADATEVESVVEQAILAEQNLATLPKDVATTGRVDPDVRASMLENARSVLSDLFTGDILTARMDTLLGAIEAEGTGAGIWIWDGGISDIKVMSTDIQGGTATVQVQATAFMVLSQTLDGDQSRPEGRGDYIMSLVKVDGHWRVAAEDFTFLAGQEP